MVGKKLDLTGQIFDRWTVLYEAPKRGRHRYWFVKCSCKDGGVKAVHQDSLTMRKSRSCGCLRKEQIKERFTTHGMSSHKIYYSWYDMNSRCNREHDTGYNHYGGAGIYVCERWRWDNEKGFENFLEDMLESWFTGATIDRKDVYGNYTPENCRWLTKTAQQRNKGIKADNTSGITGVGKYNRKGNLYFTASWTGVDGKGKTKSFSVKKYGEELALLLAIEAREKAIWELNQLGAGYSEKHGV